MDNRYYSYDCPPLMNDGRFISNYVRSSLFDQYIRNTNNLESSQDFRNFLQNNGSTILKGLLKARCISIKELRMYYFHQKQAAFYL